MSSRSSDTYFKKHERTCSECGSVMFIPSASQWSYKILYNKTANESRVIYQCSYTCNCHARLKRRLVPGLDSKERIQQLIDLEEKMKLQGKEILHPVKRRYLVEK